MDGMRSCRQAATPGRIRRTVEPGDVLEDAARRTRVWQRRPGRREELPVDQLGNEMVGHLHEVVVGRPT
jgi:hypothetical protein